MPIYEYRCGDCGEDFDVLQSFDEEAPPCEKCGSIEVARKVSRTSFVLKGGGWYKDGYSSTGASAGSNSNSSDSTGASADSSSSSSDSTGASESSSSSSDSSSKSSTSSSDSD